MSEDIDAAFQKACYPPINSDAPPMSGVSATDLSLTPMCLNTPHMKRLIKRYKEEMDGIPIKSNANSESASQNSAGMATSSGQSSIQPVSKEKSSKNNENSGPGFMDGLSGSIKGLIGNKNKDGKDKDGKDKDSKDKDDKNKDVIGLDNLFRDKLNEKWFKEQQKYFLNEKDHNNVSNMQLLQTFFNNYTEVESKTEKTTKKGDVKILEKAKEAAARTKESLEAAKTNVQEKTSAALESVKTARGNIKEKIETAAKKGGVKAIQKMDDFKIDDEILKKYTYFYLTSFYSKIHSANNVNIIEYIIVYLLDQINPKVQGGNPTNTNVKITPVSTDTPNATKSNAKNTPISTSPSNANKGKINETVFNTLLGKLSMYLYSNAEFKIISKETYIKDKIDKATKITEDKKTKKDEKKTKGGNKKQGGNGIGDSIAESIKRKKDDISEGLSSIKDIAINDNAFWSYDNSDKGGVLLIDIKTELLDINKYKDLNSVDIANKIKEYLGDIDKLDPKINDNDFKDIALKIRYNQRIQKVNNITKKSVPDIPIPKEAIVKDNNNLIKDDEKKLILKLILQGIKFMFELFLQGPGKPKQGEHKLKSVVDEFVDKSFNKIIGQIPLYNKDENDEMNHIRLNKDPTKNAEELKKAFECLITEILKSKGEESKDFPLKDTSDVIKKGEYVIYNISKKGFASTLKASCNIIIPDPKMENKGFYDKIVKYSLPNILNKGQEENNNLIYKMLSVMQDIAKEELTKNPNANAEKKGGNKNKEHTFLLGRKRIITKRGRSYYIKYNGQIISITEARAIEKGLFKTKLALSKKNKKIHHFI